MSKLWQKGYTFDEIIEQFTVGNDPVLDKKLIVYDCIGTIAHASMLAKIGILTAGELIDLTNILKEIITCAQNDSFPIRQNDEDVHTAVENFLTKRAGNLGKKIHTARSRNDQVALDIRLYMRDTLLDIAELVVSFCRNLLGCARRYKDVPFPGRTHFQRAMPSSFGLFFGAYAESLLDNLSLLENAYSLVNQSPLGSAAGYGVAIPIDRHEVAQLLGFPKVQNNVVYVGNSRGKIESIVVHVLVQIMTDLSKLSTDLIIFSTPEFGYVTLSQELCSGSSLMPQKRNPCGLELVRAKSATVTTNFMNIVMIIRGLPSGYNRDFQETKQSLMDSCDITARSVRICDHTIANIVVNKENCIRSFTQELFATDHALRLVHEEMPFRDAYAKVALDPKCVPWEDPVANICDKTHDGAPGNLRLNDSYERSAFYSTWINRERLIIEKAFTHLLKE